MNSTSIDSFLYDEEDDEQNLSLINFNNETLSDFNLKEKYIFQFNPTVVYKKSFEQKKLAQKYHLNYKFIKNQTKLIEKIFDGHGFDKVHSSSSYFNILWTSSSIKPSIYQNLHSFQRVNHFPRSSELTRKDRLFKNIEKMQQEKGLKNNDFLPTSFLLPNQFQLFKNTFEREKGLWIVKPIASSQGKGIFIIKNPNEIIREENLIVSRYISNPLLIDGYKFDVRLYVAVTCYDPLVIYLYREGLTRFATIKYDRNLSNLSNNYIHLTNYSVNKTNQDYIRCDDPDVEDFGNKWTLSAMLRLLKSEGKDTFSLMMAIEDLIIKTFLSVQYQISNACQILLSNKSNCFEVYGFDILIDDQLKPWLLEVNLSPSLSCDAPIDLKIKSHMICDLLNLILLPCVNSYEYLNCKSTKRICLKETIDCYRWLKRFQNENNSSGGFIRIFPNEDTLEYFSNYFHEKKLDLNEKLHEYLFENQSKHFKRTFISRSKYLSNLFHFSNRNSICCELEKALQRFELYQKRLNHQIYSNIIYPHQIIIQKSTIVDFIPNKKQLDLSLNHEQNKRLFRVSSAPKQEYQSKILLKNSSRPISTFNLIRKQMLTRLSSSKSNFQQQSNSSFHQETNEEFVEELTKLSTKQHQRQYSGRSQLSFVENENSLIEQTISIDQQKTNEQKEKVLEKSRQILEKNQIQNQQLAQQAKLFQEKFQKNQIYSAVSRYSHRPSIYPTSSNSIFNNQRHRIKSSN